jgi:hypothetical protein
VKSRESQAAGRLCRLTESCTVVADLQFHRISDGNQGDFEPAGAGMPNHISDAFLRTAIDCDFSGMIRLDGKVRKVYRGFSEAGIRTQFGEQAANCLRGRQHLPVRGMQQVGNGANFAERRFCQHVQSLKRFPGQRWCGGRQAIFQYFEIQFNRGQRLTCARVQLPRKARSLPLQILKNSGPPFLLRLDAGASPALTLGYHFCGASLILTILAVLRGMVDGI